MTYKSAFFTNELYALDIQTLRFKTEAEFIKCFGSEWMWQTNWNHKGKMDYLFGKSLSDCKINTIRDNGFFIDSHIFHGGKKGWFIDKSMLMPIKATTLEKLEFLHGCISWRNTITATQKQRLDDILTKGTFDKKDCEWANLLYDTIDIEEKKEKIQ